MRDNIELRQRTQDLGLTHAELVRLLNDEIETLTGGIGTVSERTVYNLMTGRTRWPHGRIRAALEAVFGCTAERLGFAPPGGHRPPPPSEDTVKRRTFLTGTATSVAFPDRPSRIGPSDVAHTRRLVDQLSIDDAGGGIGLEALAIQRSESIQRLLNGGGASQRVRSQLYALAADAITTGAWAALDGRATTRAQQHLDRAVVLAGLSGDASAVLRAWHNLSMAATQQSRHADALAATTAARSTGGPRRDPLYASLCHARAASCHARLRDRQSALRSLGHAEEALTRIKSDASRPAWTHFYDTAELHGLASIVHLRLGSPDTAEYRAHRSLAELRPEFVRNRLYYTAHLALCQLQQDVPELACATATKVITRAGDAPTSARVRSLLRDFRVMLAATSYGRTRAARHWLESTMKCESITD